MPERTLTVKIIGDDRSLQQAFKRSEKAGKGFQVGVSGIGAAAARSILPAAAAAVSVQKAFQLAGQSVDDASAVAEEVAKSEQVFESSSKEVVSWSKTLADSFGVSQRAALEATGVFGNLFSVVGIGPAAAAEMSRGLVELAADMASFNNASPEDVLAAIRSGLVGEAEPLRRYGVLLSEARVQQVALATTGKRTVASLTQQEKAQARYTIILQDTLKAQGDVERTADSLANQQRRLRANLANLSAGFGGLLIPKVLETIEAVNLLIRAYKRLEDAFPGGGGDGGRGFSPGKLFAGPIRIFTDQIDNLRHMGENIDLILQGKGFQAIDTRPVFERIGEALTKPVEELAKTLEGAIPFYARIDQALQGPIEGLIGSLNTYKAKVEKAEAIAARLARQRSAKAFDDFVLGMGLKFDKAQLTSSTNDDLASLRELEASIVRRIAAEGKTFKLVQLLTNTRLRINSVLEGQAQDAADAISGAFSEALDSLDLNLDIAKSTRGFNDDLRALRAIEAQILKQIAAEGRTTELLRRLFENREEQADTLNAQRNAADFALVGLTAEGDKPVPGRGSILKKARGLQEQIKGTVLDTPKNNRILDAIVRRLRDKTKQVGKDVRQAYLDMLNDIASALDQDPTSGGPLTKFAKRGVGKLIEGLGLSPEQTKEIRQRFSQFGRLDLTGGGGAARPPGRTVRPTREEVARHRGERDVNVNVYIDGQKVEATVTRRQQKKRGRNAPQRRGVNPGSRR